MRLPQLSLIIDNKPGSMIAPCKVLSDAGINIVTLSLADSERVGVLRLIVAEWQRARELLEAAGYEVSVDDVLAIEVTDKPGGLIDLLGTADFREVERRVLAGDPQAAAVVEAMVYQIAKNIAALLPAFDGELVDRVLLTGGLARSQLVTDGLEKAVRALGCGVTVYPGENEMAALAKGALRVLQGKEDAREYRPEEKR